MPSPPSDPVATSPSALTSLTLLERVKNQDPQAWQRLVHLYGPLVYQWCRRWQVSGEDAGDISQDVFQAVAAHIGTFRRDSARHSFRGWLWTIARNKMRDHFRRRHDQPVAAGGSTAQMQLQLVPELLPEDGDEETATASLVHRALELLHGEFNARHWQMFWRAVVEGHAPKEIAADLGVTPDAVRMAKSRVLRRLREELTEPE